MDIECDYIAIWQRCTNDLVSLTTDCFCKNVFDNPDGVVAFKKFKLRISLACLDLFSVILHVFPIPKFSKFVIFCIITSFGSFKARIRGSELKKKEV